MAIRRAWSLVRDSMWFVPAIWVVASAALAFALIAVDTAATDLPSRFPLIFGGGADGARGLLSAIAGSMITVAGVTFSITIVALQLASSQFSPRVLRTFMRDRPSQVVLGAFIGAFTYAILVLRSIRGRESEAELFVPALGVTVGILYALLALGMLVYFIHHISSRIQVSTIVANIADETTNQIHHDWPEGDEEPEWEPPPEAAGVVTASGSGYLQLLGSDDLVGLAKKYRTVIRLEVRTGDWVQQDAPLFSIWPATAAEGMADELRKEVSLGDQRSIEQDAAFGIRQLVDVAVKAISPGINDPTSATDCIDRLGQILVAAGNRHPPQSAHLDDEGQVRLVVPYRRWPELVGLAFDQIRQYSAGSTDISIALATTLATIASAVPSQRHEPLEKQANLIAAAASEVVVEADRRRIEQAVTRVLLT